MYQVQRIQKASIKSRNRYVLTKFLKIICFVLKAQLGLARELREHRRFPAKRYCNACLNADLKDLSSRVTYTSVASSLDQFLKCIDKKLDIETCSRITAAGDYSSLADETTDTADRDGMSIFIRYVNSDTQKVKGEYLGLAEMVGSKGTEALCTKNCEVLDSKDILITQLCFYALEGTDAMSGEHSGFQRRLKHETPYSKYVNCINYRLELVFVHLIPKFESLQEVDANVLAVWKAIKYSSVKASIFGEAEKVQGFKNVKLQLRVGSLLEKLAFE